MNIFVRIQLLKVKILKNYSLFKYNNADKLECRPVPNVMAALPNIGGALCSMPQSLADANY